MPGNEGEHTIYDGIDRVEELIETLKWLADWNQNQNWPLTLMAVLGAQNHISRIMDHFRDEAFEKLSGVGHGNFHQGSEERTHTMSDEEREQYDFDDGIEIVEALIQTLKSSVVREGGASATSAAHTIVALEGVLCIHKPISDQLELMRDSAVHKAGRILSMLRAFFQEYDEWDREAFWKQFHDKLEDIEETNEAFRRLLFQYEEKRGYGTTLLHVVCMHNPPIDVVKTLMRITSFEEDREGRLKYNLSPDGGGQFKYHLIPTWGSPSIFPLHMVAMYGGSIDLVKLLVEADPERKGLQSDAGPSSVFHFLVSNKEKHDPQVFSEILRYLVLVTFSANKTAITPFPLSCLWQKLGDDKLCPSVLRQNGLDPDFVFLVKARCLRHLLKEDEEEDVGSDYEKMHVRIDSIPMVKAFIICLPCYLDEGADGIGILGALLAADSSFVNEKDDNGHYQIHNMLNDPRSYFAGQRTSTARGVSLLISVHICAIIEAFPGCARHVNGEGLLPMHIVADARRSKMSAEARLFVVRALQKAYPEATGIIDNSTGLPPFALAARALSKTNPFDRWTERSNPDTLGHSVSISFFLLRESPTYFQILFPSKKRSVNASCQ